MRRFIALTFALFAVSCTAAQAAEQPGSLTQPAPPQACFDNDGAGGCTPFTAPNHISSGISGLAFSPDGKQLYTAAGGGGVTFFRDAGSGDLTTPAAAQGGLGFSSVVAAPDGRTVFYGTPSRSDPGGVFGIKRDPASGLITTVGSCVVETGTTGLQCPQAPGLRDVQGVAISPDGKTLYAAAQLGGPSATGAITAYNVAADGALSQIDCRPHVNAASGPCSNPNGSTAGLGGVNDVEVSADGRFVYAVSSQDNALIGFNRFTSGPNTGKLGAPTNCHALNAINNVPFCTATPGLLGAKGLALSPDGADVYVASFNTGLAQFRRNQVSGTLSPNGCFGGPNCTVDPVADEGYREVVVAPDGNTVYAIGGNGANGYVKAYSRDPQTGKLTPIGCVSTTALGDCTQAAGIKNAATGVVSADGRDLYVGAVNSPGLAGSVARFAITQRAGNPAPAPAPAEAPPAETAPAAPAGEAPATPPAAPADAIPTLKVAGLRSTVSASKLRSIAGAAADDRGIARVQVAVVKPSGGAKVVAARKRCQVLASSGRLKAVRPIAGTCAATGFLTAKGTTKWSLKLKKRLPRGKYVVFARATDNAGQTSKVVRRAITVR